MKLSVAILGAASAVSGDFELPEICEDLAVSFGDGDPFGVVNCWASFPERPDSSEVDFFGNNTVNLDPPANAVPGECGFQYKGGSMMNSTCYGFKAIDGAYVMIGNGAFVAKGVSDGNVIVGLDFSGDINIIQSWPQDVEDAEAVLDKQDKYLADLRANAKLEPDAPPFEQTFSWQKEPANICGFYNDFQDQGLFFPPFCRQNEDGYYKDYAIMITNQHARDANNNYAIANYGGAGSIFSVNFPNQACDEFGFSLHDENQADLQILKADYDCTLVFAVKKGQAQLLYFQGSLNQGVVDFWDGVTIQAV